MDVIAQGSDATGLNIGAIILAGIAACGSVLTALIGRSARRQIKTQNGKTLGETVSALEEEGKEQARILHGLAVSQREAAVELRTLCERTGRLEDRLDRHMEREEEKA